MAVDSTAARTREVEAPRAGGLSDDPGAPTAARIRAGTASRSQRLLAAIMVMGLTLTALATWAAARADENAEQRLLAVQTRQAAAVLSTAILVIQQPLSDVLDAERLVPRSRAVPTFERLMGHNVGATQPFVSASLWHVTASRLHEIASAGSAPALTRHDPAFHDLTSAALRGTTSIVRLVPVGGQFSIVYAYGDARSGLVVYAERPIPKNRRASADSNSAFAEINYAIYLGRATGGATLTTTNVDPATLPLHGVTSRSEIPFGNTVLTLSTSPRGHLGSPLSRRLPWILLVAGVLLTLGAWTVARQLVCSRNRAESDTATIAALYERVEALYGEQRSVAVRLQRALLPQTNPDIPELDVAGDYVAGARGVDIGGDWFSVIRVGEDRFAFVVGDVSGKGIDAVAVMAHARFTLRAYLVEGDAPHAALEKCSHQFDIGTDGHIVTVVAGVGNAETGELTLASAGHPPPLLYSGDSAEFLDVPAGPPLGIGASTYVPLSVTMPPGSTLISYTDGLIERRGEDLSVGMDRLTRAVLRLGKEPVSALVQEVLLDLHDPAASDDIAVLALRRRLA